MKPYEALSRVYDRLNAEVDYASLADFYETLFSLLPQKPQLVLDLGCGTGPLTVELSRRGYDMIGVDGSAEMLSHAYERKAKEGQNNILFLQQEMQNFELYGTVGAVVSSLDCMNYLTEKEDLLKCFSLVHNYLDPDGIFIFDVNTPYKFETVFADNAYILEDDTCYCGWQNEYDEETHLCHFYLSVFEELENGRYRRKDEEQVERCYEKEELIRLLEAAGFADIAFFGGTDGSPATATSERWFIKAICKK